MERKGLVKPVCTTCPIGMHLRFYTSRVTYGKKYLLCMLDVEKIFRSRVQIAKTNSPWPMALPIDFKIARFKSPLLKLSAIV